MRVVDALPILEAACGKPFREIFKDHPEDLRTNKGHAGQLLLKHIGLKLDSDLCDFEDGELKTNKADPSGQPRETMWITQISKNIDALLCNPASPFIRSPLYHKVRNLIYLPVVKNSELAGDWYFVRVVHVQAEPGTPLFTQLEEDYEAICGQLRAAVSSGDGFIHTANGHYIQVRSKDSIPYHPIWSDMLGRPVSNKNHAFYFQKQWMIDALAGGFE